MEIKNYKIVALATFAFVTIFATTTAMFAAPSGKRNGAWKYFGEFDSCASWLYTETITVPASVPKDTCYSKTFPLDNAAFWITAIKITKESGCGDVECLEGPGLNYVQLSYKKGAGGDFMFTIHIFGRASHREYNTLLSEKN